MYRIEAHKRTAIRVAAGLLLVTLLAAGWLLAVDTPIPIEAAVLRGLHPRPDNPLAVAFWRAASHLGDGGVRAAVAMVVLLGLWRRLGGRTIGAATVVLVSGNLLSSALKLGVDRARPQVVPHLDSVSSASFPSGHTLNATLTYLLLAWLIARLLRTRWHRRALIGVAAALSLLTGIARLALGVHWPTDVLAGWLAAVAWLGQGLPLIERYWPAASSTSSR